MAFYRSAGTDECHCLLKLNGMLTCAPLPPGASNFARRATAATQRTTSSDRPLLLHSVAVSTSPLGATLIRMTSLPAGVGGSDSSPRRKHCLAPGCIWDRMTASALGTGVSGGEGSAPSVSADCPPSAFCSMGVGDCVKLEASEAAAARGREAGHRHPYLHHLRRLQDCRRSDLRPDGLRTIAFQLSRPLFPRGNTCRCDQTRGEPGARVILHSRAP
jgi:hypothetical protein